MATKKKNFKEAGVSAFLSDVPDPITMPTETIVKELKINPVFQALIPPLSTEEYTQLEENLLENGIREAISIWGDTIIDGHNRYAIATAHNLPYTTVSYEFANEDDVKLWIFKNQIGRRNLPPVERVKLALILKPVIAEKAKEQQIRKSANSVPQKSAEQTSDSVLQISTKQNVIEDSVNSVPQISAEQTPIETRKVIADMAGVSHDTVSKVEKILDAGTPEILEKLKRGDISINKAYQETKLQERKNNTISSVQASPLLNLPSKYSVIYAGCPFESEFLESGDKPTDTPCPVMNINELKKLEIPSEEDAVLLMWSSSPFLEKSLQVMNAWGFKYKTNMIWDKQLITTGQWLYGQHEILLIGIKGKFSLPTEDVNIPSVYREKQDKHSVKPMYFYEQIERMFPGEKYLALFAHKKQSDLWETWGNQVQLPESEGEGE